MPDLNFQIAGAKPVPYAGTPLLGFDLRIGNREPERIQTVALRAQIQLEVTRRQYSTEEQERLRDLFGEPSRWGQTLRTMLWTHVTTMVPSFAGAAQVDLQVPCTFDFNVAAVKYFYGLGEGEIPLCFQFSGSVFYESVEGLQVAPISWDKECRYRLPVQLWRDMMEMYYPNSAWLCLRRDVFERLREYKSRSGIATWEQMLENLLQEAEEGVRQ